MYLVDTNVLSELAKPRPSSAVLRWFAHQDQISLSVVSLEELAYGVARAPASRRSTLISWLKELVDSVELVLDVSSAIAIASGDLRATRDNVGRPVAQADMLIAATALVHGFTLATRNVADFEGCGISVLDPFRT